jgi:hypothetical protein
MLNKLYSDNGLEFLSKAGVFQPGTDYVPPQFPGTFLCTRTRVHPRDIPLIQHRSHIHEKAIAASCFQHIDRPGFSLARKVLGDVPDTSEDLCIKEEIGAPFHIPLG